MIFKDESCRFHSVEHHCKSELHAKPLSCGVCWEFCTLPLQKDDEKHHHQDQGKQHKIDFTSLTGYTSITLKKKTSLITAAVQTQLPDPLYRCAKSHEIPNCHPSLQLHYPQLSKKTSVPNTLMFPLPLFQQSDKHLELLPDLISCLSSPILLWAQHWTQVRMQIEIRKHETKCLCTGVHEK